ncbi:MAG TPA: acyl-CoA dehydrogenase family protein [Burkholderiales bacterium]|nr:acyl-CoA dehydrogenase family protein [Burkholderiales bacterium]
MDLNPTPEQTQVVDAFRRVLEGKSTPAHVRAAEKTGFDAALWREAVDMGIPFMGVPESGGGSGLGLLDIALLAEVYGEFIAPIPFIETNVAGRLLARAGEPGRALLEAVTGKGVIATVALTDTKASGKQRPIPAGAVAEVVIMLEGDKLLAVKGAAPGAALNNMGSGPLAFRSKDERGASTTVLAEGARARELHSRALDEWRTLTAAALEGLGRKAIAIGVEYAKNRKAFGAPIGSYQGVAHPLADSATDLDGAQLLARSAAAAADEEDQGGGPKGNAGRFSVLASMALAFCAERAQRAAHVGLHVHGGYGFTLEYDIQMYVRRAKAWPLALDDPRKEYQRIAGMLFNQPGTMEKWIFG